MLEKGAWINGSNQILVACWEFEGRKKCKWGGELDQQELLEDIEKADFVVAHSAKFELGWLARCGLDLRSVLVYDTLLAEWVIGGNRWLQEALSLDESLQRHGLPGKHPVGRLIRLGVDTRNIPKPWLGEYCFSDTQDCKALFHKQLAILQRDGLLHIQYARCLLVPVLTDMEAQGLTLNKERVEAEHSQTIAKYNKLLDKLTEVTGGINFKSPKQLSAFLYDTLGFEELKGRDRKPARTPAGGRKTDASTIAGLKAKSKAQREFLELIKELAALNAALTKGLNFFKEVCENHDCTFYGILNQGTTVTHRLSSSGREVQLPPTQSKKKPKGLKAQLQNIDRDFKSLFQAKDPDWLILEADGAQLEYRVAAALSQDPVAIQEIVDGVDIHSITAQTLTDAGEPTTRQAAKSRSFRPLFAGNSGTPAERAYCKFFQEKYNVIYSTQMAWVQEVAARKQLRTPYGFIAYWPDTVIQASGYITNTTKIFNLPIQQLATAEIIPITLIWLWYMTAGMRLKIVLTVHDSVIMEIHPDEVENVKPIIAECFTSRVYETLENLYHYEFKSVPLAAGIKVGKFWSEGEEVTATVFPHERSVIHWKVK